MAQSEKQQQIHLIDYLILLLKRKKLIVLGSLACMVLAIDVCLVMTPVYTATCKLMPPEQGQKSGASRLMAQLGNIAGITLSGEAGPSGDLYIGILQTDPVLDRIIERFDLLKLYGAGTWHQGRRYLVENVLNPSVDLKSNLLTISVDDADPKRAADMANAFVDELSDLLNKISDKDAAARRQFLEDELKNASETLTQAEVAVQGFQETTGALVMNDQASAVLQRIAGLKAQITAKDVQIKVMKTYSTENNPDMKRAEEELRGLWDHLKKLEEMETTRWPDLFIPTSKMPSVGVQYLRKMRDFRLRETLYESLLKYYQAASLEEDTEKVQVQVVQAAIPPEVRSKPRTLTVALLAGAVSLFVFTLMAFVQEMIERAANDPSNEDRIREFKKVGMRI